MKKGLILFSLSLILLCSGCAITAKDGKNDPPVMQDWQEVFRLTETTEHDKTAFTEGLFIYNGDLYESTGLNDHSRLARYEGIAQDELIAERELSADVFAEGSAVLDGTLYMLTWRNGAVLRFDPETLEQKDVLEYPREGWGLTTDGRELIAGDGSDCLYFMDDALHLTKTLHVSCGGEKLENINELEYDGQYIWANVWTESYLVAIDPETGNVVRKVDFSELLPENASAEYCLNGIAFDGEYYYFTGKDWPVMYKMELIDDKAGGMTP